jgi:hypothetical protein
MLAGNDVSIANCDAPSRVWGIELPATLAVRRRAAFPTGSGGQTIADPC